MSLILCVKLTIVSKLIKTNFSSSIEYRFVLIFLEDFFFLVIFSILNTKKLIKSGVDTLLYFVLVYILIKE